MLKKKIRPNFQRIIELFSQILSLSSQKYGFGIRDPEKPIPDPGSRGQKGTGSRIRIRNTAKKDKNEEQCVLIGSMEASHRRTSITVVKEDAYMVRF
jgi:hypothetical protein